MAAHIEFGGVMGGGAPVYTGLSYAAKLTTTSSAQSAAAAGGEYARVSAIGAGIYFTVGSNPTAVSTGVNMRYVADGSSVDLGPLSAGDKIACIDAA